MTKSKGQLALEKICISKGVKMKDVEKIFDVYSSDLSEQQMELELAKHPKGAVEVATKAFLGIAQ